MTKYFSGSIKTIVLFLLIVLSQRISAQSAVRDSFYVANWNVENLFDTVDNPDKNDEEFLPGSKKEWNDYRYETKIHNLATVINYMNGGCGPDILGVEEVENIMVLKNLTYSMRSRDYVMVYRDSPDERGIATALIYDRSVFMIDSVAAIIVKLPNERPTRNILHVVLIHKKSNQKIHVYVNHWPSRSGGEEKSEPNRIAAAEVLKASLDTLARTNPNSEVIILGDFNDNPNDESIVKKLGAHDYDCTTNELPKEMFVDIAAKKYENGKGSYLYYGKWEMIDQIILSKSLFEKDRIMYGCNSFEIIKPEFMVFKEGKRMGGAIPTYEGNRYIGGYSDHFPVGAKFFVKDKK